jgi:hypothetical protein
MAWGKAGSVNTESSGTVNTLDVSSLPDSKFYMGLFHDSTHGQNASVRMGNSSIDTGSNYAFRSSRNGGSDGTETSNSDGIRVNDNAGSSPWFSVMYIANISGEEKLLIGNAVEQMTAGAGNAPNRNEAVGKFAFTSNPIDIIQMKSSNMPSGTNFSMLGSDITPTAGKPTDVQEGSRWEETDTKKMYHYEEQVPDYDYPMTTDPRTNTFNSSICTITHANSTLQMNQLTATGTSGSATYIDLGSNLSTKWVMRFKTKQTGYTNYQYNSQFQVGMSSVAPTSTAYNISSSLNWIGFRWYFGTQFSSPYVGIEPRIGQNTGDNSHSNTNARLYGKPNHVSDTTTPYYHEFIWNVDTFTYNLYTNENYTGTPTATATMSSSTNTQWVTGTPSSISGLRYFVFKMGGDSNMGVWVNQLDDVQIWDGVTVATTGNAWKELGT